MRRTAEDAAKTRQALLEAALKSFAEKGWQGATFEYIAERAGVTRGALHHHFRSKRDLLSAALEWGWSKYTDHLFAKDLSVSDSREWLQQVLVEFVTLLHSDELFWAIASTTVLVAPQAEGDIETKHSALNVWHAQITAALGSYDSALPAQTIARLVLILLQGFTVTAVTRPQDLPPIKDLDLAIAALVNGMLA